MLRSHEHSFPLAQDPVGFLVTFLESNAPAELPPPPARPAAAPAAAADPAAPADPGADAAKPPARMF